MREISLRNSTLVALVDDGDYERVARYRWRAHCHHGNWYAVRSLGRLTIRMHRFILELNNPKVQVDHKNGDGLDNTRENIRIATVAQNQYNQKRRKDNPSGYKGVNRQQRSDKWRARIKVSGRMVQLGVFVTPEEAARAYDQRASELWGDYARLNFPNEVMK